jgi:hypothetical protein
VPFVSIVATVRVMLRHCGRTMLSVAAGRGVLRVWHCVMVIVR